MESNLIIFCLTVQECAYKTVTITSYM